MNKTDDAKRSDTLTVLCILSFIGSALLFMYSMNGYREANLTYDLVVQRMNQSQDSVARVQGNEKGVKAMKKVTGKVEELLEPAKMKNFSLLGMIFNALTFIGALLMFGHRKLGFWAYLAGTLGLVLGPVLVYGTGNFLVYGIAFLYALVGLVFVLLYSRQLKYLS